MSTHGFVRGVAAALMTASVVAIGGLSACSTSKPSSEASAPVAPTAEAPGGMQAMLPTWDPDGNKEEYAKALVGHMTYVATESGAQLNPAELSLIFYEADQVPADGVDCGNDGVIKLMTDGEYAGFTYCNSEILVVPEGIVDEIDSAVQLIYAMGYYLGGGYLSPTSACYHGALVKTLKRMNELSEARQGVSSSVSANEAGSYNTGYNQGAAACLDANS